MVLDRKALAAKARGLAPAPLVKHLVPGAVFHARDVHISLPEAHLDGAGPRDVHPTRRVILFQVRELNVTERPKTVLVIPCSASAHRPGPWDLEIPGGEEGFDKSGVVAYASLLQPLLKSDLVSHVGHLRNATLLALQLVVARNMGILSAHDVPLPAPRQHGAPSGL